MIRRGVSRTFGAIWLAIALAACSSPDPALYTLGAAPGRPSSGGPRIVMVQHVSLARYLERSQIVRSSENYRLEVMSNDWWGEPLSSMLGRVLIEELAQRMPQSTVVSDSGAVSASPDATVQLNILRLDEDSSGQLILQAQASVEFKRSRTPEVRSFRIVQAPSSPGTPGEVAAISSAVGQLADGLVAMLTAGPSRT